MNEIKTKLSDADYLAFGQVMGMLGETDVGRMANHAISRYVNGILSEAVRAAAKAAAKAADEKTKVAGEEVRV